MAPHECGALIAVQEHLRAKARWERFSAVEDLLAADSHSCPVRAAVRMKCAKREKPSLIHAEVVYVD